MTTDEKPHHRFVMTQRCRPSLFFDNSGRGPQTNSFLVADSEINDSNTSVVRFSAVNSSSLIGSENPDQNNLKQSEEGRFVVEA
jgi:hypothetical protein